MANSNNNKKPKNEKITHNSHVRSLTKGKESVSQIAHSGEVLRTYHTYTRNRHWRTKIMFSDNNMRYSYKRMGVVEEVRMYMSLRNKQLKTKFHQTATQKNC